MNPSTPESLEWANYQTLDEMLQVIQIPEEILKNMTREALIETIINHPLSVNFLVYDTFEEGYEAVKKFWSALLCNIIIYFKDFNHYICC